jgi:hypothetical protein
MREVATRRRTAGENQGQDRFRGGKVDKPRLRGVDGKEHALVRVPGYRR